MIFDRPILDTQNGLLNSTAADPHKVVYGMLELFVCLQYSLVNEVGPPQELDDTKVV